jgi:hypothetical protein
MSMIGEYARLSPAELERALGDLGPARALIDGAGPDEARRTDIDKAWDILHFLLRRIDFPVDVIDGEEEFPDAGDWGYGPPCYLTPDQVRTAAAALTATAPAALVGGVTAAELVAAELYPGFAEEEADQLLAYALEHYRSLVPFFEAAARAGDAIVVWLD